MSTTLRPDLSRPATQWRWLFALWLVLGVLSVVYVCWDRQETLKAERRHLRQQTGMVHDNMARQLRAIHTVLGRLAEEPVPTADNTAERRRVNARLRAFGEALAGVRTLSMLDADGTLVASDRDELIGKNFAYRDYYRAARDATDPEALIVGAPFRAVLDGGWYLMLGRTMRADDGSFAGAVMATLDPEQFLTLLESVRYAPDMVAALVHGDGVRFLLASEHPMPPGIDVGQPQTLFSRHRASGEAFSELRGRLLPDEDATEYLAAMRTIQPPGLHMDRPFVTSAAREWDAVLAEWRAGAAVLAVAWLVLGALAAALLYVAQQRRRELRRHARALTEREAQLRARWRAVLQATSLGVWEWRGEGQPTYFSPGWKGLLGWGDDEIPDDGLDWRAWLHPDEREQVLAQMARHLRGDTQSYEATHRIRRNDGSWRWVLSRGRVLERDSQGRPTYFVGTFGDLPEQGEERARLDLLAAQVPGMLYQYQIDADGRNTFPYASAGALDVYGYTPEQLREDALPVFGRILPDDAQALKGSIEASAQSLQPWRHEYRVLLPGRGERWLSGHARPQRLPSGALLWHGYIQDVTEAKQQALQLQETERLLKHLMSEMPLGLCMVDGSGRMYFRNRRFLDYFGYTEAEVATLQDWWRRAYPEPGYREQVARSWERAVAQAAQGNGEIEPQEYRTTARDGTERTMAIGGLAFGDHFLATFFDRTEQKAQSELLRKLAYVDSLTSVANRRHFDQALAAEWPRCRRSRKPLALVLFDIDHFKQYNDAYGHQAGDACLRAVAGALRSGLARSHDVVARYGGEEFVCLLPESDAAGALAKAEALCRAVQALGIAHRASSTAPVVTVSAGVAVLVPDGEHAPEDLLACADRHLYQAKVAGRNRAVDGSCLLSNK